MDYNDDSLFSKPQGKHTGVNQPTNVSSSVSQRSYSSASHQRVTSGGSHSYNNPNYYTKKRKRTHSRRRKRMWLRVAIIAFASIFAIFIVCGVICGFQVKSAVASITNASKQIGTLQDDVAKGNYDSASQTVQNLGKMTAEIDGMVNQPQWYIMTAVPVVGHDITVARVYTKALNGATNDVLVPMVNTLKDSNIDSLIQNDTINVSSVQTLMNVAAQGASKLNASTAELENVDDFNISQLQEKIGSYKSTFLTLNSGFQLASTLAPVVGDILGANGPRTYLIVAEGSAEIRANGGFPGSAGTIEFDNGHYVLNTFDKITNVIDWNNTPRGIEITEQEITYFTEQFRNAQDSGHTPDFVRTGEILTASYRDKNGFSPDGIIAIAPAMVQRILSVVGEISLSDGTKLNGQNATKVLLHDIYWKYCTSQTQAYDLSDLLFSEAADLTFKKLTKNLNSSTLLKACGSMIDGFTERDLMVYFVNQKEQEAAVSANMAGGLPNSEKAPQSGVFFNMYTWSKMGWWVDINTEIVNSKQNPDGSKEYRLKSVFKNSLTTKEAKDGDGYITGSGGDMFPRMYLYAPRGGTISDVKCDQGIEFINGVHNSINMCYTPTVNFGCGDSYTVTYTVKTSTKATEELEIIQTPTLTKYRVGKL